MPHLCRFGSVKRYQKGVPYITPPPPPPPPPAAVVLLLETAQGLPTGLLVAAHL